MGNVKDRLWSSPLVPILVSLPDLPVVGLPGRRRGSLRCGSLLDNFGTPHQKTYALVSFCNHSYPGWCTSGALPWRRRATAWYSHPPATVWWRGRGGSDYLRSIPWSHAQQLSFGGESPPCIIFFVVRIFLLPPITGDICNFRCLPGRHRPCPCGWLPSACRNPWTKGFPQMRLPSWG